MIQIGARNSKITLSFPGSKKFEEIVQTLKLYHCEFNPAEKDWTVSTAKYELLREKLADIDVISISYLDEKRINAMMLEIGKQQIIFPERRLFKQNLLKKTPIIGLTPNEDFQKVDILKGISRNRYIFDLDMGLGKSYILSGVLSHLAEYDDLDKVLILTTRSGTYNFYHELLKFTYFKPEEITIANKDSTSVFESDTRIIITDFDTFRLLSDKYYKKRFKKSGVKYRVSPIPVERWIGKKKACLILDESHSVGNPKSRRYATLKLISEHFYFRYLSSGTIADKVEKIYSQFNILDPGLVHNLNFTDWLAEYASVGNRFSQYAINYFKKDKIDSLMESIRKTYASHRRTDDHLQLPENFIKKIYVRMSDDHRKIYESFVKYEMGEMSDMNMRNIQNKFPYLMLSLDNPYFLNTHLEKFPADLKKNIMKFKDASLEKLNVLDDLIDEHVIENEEKIIIWTIHPHTAELLKKKYEKHHPVVVNGEIEIPKGVTRDEQKRALVEEFKTNKKSKILIAGIAVLNTAVTITEATTQVYLERDFNYITMSQSVKRIHRHGQTKSVNTIYLTYDYSLDNYISKNLEDKDLLNQKLLSKETLTTEEWRSIFNGSEEENYSFVD